MIIIPSPFTNDPEELRGFIKESENILTIFQVDINDGTFLGNKSILPEAVGDITTNLSFDFHLMVKEPINWVEKCVRAGGDRIIGHIEHMSDQGAFVGKCQEAGVKIGLALNIDTSCSEIDPSLLTDLDVILLMSYQAGKGGQVFDNRVIEKMKYFSEIKRKDSTPFSICSDGGIRPETIKLARDAGADEVTVGKWLFEGDIRDNINKLESALR
jgi:ribulose-phosphate 3-epimerase